MLLSVATVSVTYLLGFALFNSLPAAALSAAIVAIAPDVVTEAPIIGVDVVMVFFCLLTSILGLAALKRQSIGWIIACAICAGLAVSSKYNAAPIVIVPALVAFFSVHRLRNLLLVSVLLPAAFLAASPYILLEFPLFYKHVSYEVWHYAVAGHEGHSGTPGLPQVAFYLRWLMQDATGVVVLLLACVGGISAARARNTSWAVVLAFPALYFLEMILQKVNFTRNMVVAVPYVAILAGAGSNWIFSSLQKWPFPLRQSAAVLFALVCLFKPARDTALRLESVNQESRVPAEEWIKGEMLSGRDIAASGQLQFSSSVYGLPGVSRIDEKLAKFDEMLADGFESLVVSDLSLAPPLPPYLQRIATFSGDGAPQRVVHNPTITALRFNPSIVEPDFASGSRARMVLEAGGHASLSPCVQEVGEHSSQEAYCWLQRRWNSVTLDPGSSVVRVQPDGMIALDFEVMSPWDGQRVVVSLNRHAKEFLLPDSMVGKWQRISAEFPAEELFKERVLGFQIEKIRSPKQVGSSDDSRRLGLAIRSVRLNSPL